MRRLGFTSRGQGCFAEAVEEEASLENLGTHAASLISNDEGHTNADIKEEAVKPPNTGRRKPQEKWKPKPLFSAEQYVRQVWKAESSAATSVLSEATGTKLRGLFSLQRRQGRSQRRVESFARQDSPAAV